MTIHTSTDDLIATLATKGYAVLNQAILADLTMQLRNQAYALQKNGVMRRATTGKNSTDENREADTPSSLRGDFTYWLENTDNNSSSESITYKNITAAYLQHMETLRLLLNQTLFLGLFDFETHFAIYPAGAGYSKHLDRFHQSATFQNGTTPAENTQRKISVILYLNKDWQAQDGGQLRLYLNDTQHIDIEPLGGRMVVFLSDQFWHEVLPAKRERISLTGWFRTR